MAISTIEFTGSGAVRILDQRLLPGEETYADLTSVEEVALAIETLAVRGAPLIGIAAAMGISVSTVRNHTQHVLLKLHVHTRFEAVPLGRKLGLI